MILGYDNQQFITHADINETFYANPKADFNERSLNLTEVFINATINNTWKQFKLDPRHMIMMSPVKIGPSNTAMLDSFGVN